MFLREDSKLARNNIKNVHKLIATGKISGTWPTFVDVNLLNRHK